MPEPFLSQIKLFAFDQAPRGWARCDGQLLPINQNQALFALLGTTYGGDGRVTFALPDLRARVPIHFDNAHHQGARGGEQSHTVTANEMPAHTHVASAKSALGTSSTPGGQVWAGAPSQLYAGAPDGAMAATTVLPAGGSQAHENQSPYLVLNFCIAVVGIFPTHSQ